MNNELIDISVRLSNLIMELSKSIEGESPMFLEVDKDELKSYEIIDYRAYCIKQERNVTVNDKGEEEGVRNTGYYLFLWGEDRKVGNKTLTVTYSILPFEYSLSGIIKTVMEVDESSGEIISEMETSFGLNSQFFTPEEISKDMLDILVLTRDSMKKLGYLKDTQIVGVINV